jgi:hypothetical protein
MRSLLQQRTMDYLALLQRCLESVFSLRQEKFYEWEREIRSRRLAQ